MDRTSMAASRLMCRHRVIGYLPSIRAAVQHFRAFSSYDEQTPELRQLRINSEQHNDSETVWPDKSLGPFSPQDKRFPLPGLVGGSNNYVSVKSSDHKSIPKQPDILTEDLPADRHARIYEQFSQTVQEFNEVEDLLADRELQGESVLECIAQPCPVLIRKDFQELFPDRDINECQLTVITMCQQTQNDMTGWSEEVEAEREELLATFINGASDICKALNQCGHWADFIEPSSGRPYLGAFTNATFFETDERYRHFGFEIEDLGCCKVIRHHMWGTRSYIGSIFTDAPMDHPSIQQLIRPRQ